MNFFYHALAKIDGFIRFDIKNVVTLQLIGGFTMQNYEKSSAERNKLVYFLCRDVVISAKPKEEKSSAERNKLVYFLCRDVVISAKLKEEKSS